MANLGERIGTGTQLRRGLAVALQATVGVLPVLLVSRRLLMTGRVLHRLGGERVHRGWLEFPSDGVRAALVCATRGEHELDIARALVAAVLLYVLAVYALAHDASSCRLSRRTQPALSALSLALPRLLAVAALDLLHPALR